MKKSFIVLLLIILSMNAFSQEISGSWVGELSFGGNKLDLIFHITQENNQLATKLDIPMQNLKGADAASTTFEDNKLVLSFPQFQINYEGTLNEQGEIEGHFKQSGLTIPLNLKKGGITMNRPQEPKPPFSYHTEEIIFESADQTRLSGTLSLPKKTGKFPLVIIISGSGPQDRDGLVFGHKPYLILADHLTKNGIGVLRYDERGVGKSAGNFASANIETLSSDVIAAMEYAVSRKDFEISQLGLIGHSIGGLIAPRIASQHPEINFIVLMAGPGIHGEQVMLEQKADLERKLGLNEIQIAQGQELVKGAYDIITQSGLNEADLKDSVTNFYIEKYGALIPANQRQALVNQVTGNEVVDLIRSKPEEYLSKVQCPVLALNGDHDFQVLSSSNLPAIEKVLKENGNTQVTTIELKGINHLFQESETGLLDEYSKIEQTMAPKVLDLIKDWILEIAQ